jgi:hypothetical protein
VRAGSPFFRSTQGPSLLIEHSGGTTMQPAAVVGIVEVVISAAVQISSSSFSITRSLERMSSRPKRRIDIYPFFIIIMVW